MIRKLILWIGFRFPTFYFRLMDKIGERQIQKDNGGYGDIIETNGWEFRRRFYPCDLDDLWIARVHRKSRFNTKGAAR